MSCASQLNTAKACVEGDAAACSCFVPPFDTVFPEEVKGAYRKTMAFEVPGDPAFCDAANMEVCTILETTAGCCCGAEITEYVNCAFETELNPVFGAGECPHTCGGGGGGGGDGGGGEGGGGMMMIVAIAFVLIILCCCCGGFFYYRRRKNNQNQDGSVGGDGKDGKSVRKKESYSNVLHDQVASTISLFTFRLQRTQVHHGVIAMWNPLTGIDHRRETSAGKLKTSMTTSNANQSGASTQIPTKTTSKQTGTRSLVARWVAVGRSAALILTRTVKVV
jgi:hypothetical protein